MTRNAGVSIENAFNKGLITEVTGVSSPENSVVETVNMIYDRRGKAIKRGAFKYEDNFVLNPVNGEAHTEYVWKTISNNVGRELVVTQIGSQVRFFESISGQALSANRKTFVVSLLDYKTPNFTNAQVRSTGATYATGRGYLFIAHPFCDTVYVKYDATTDTITTTRITLKIRDFEGIDDNRRVDQRPTSLTSTHKYNLFNQGWYTSVVNNAGTEMNALDYWRGQRSDNPSNCDVWWYYTGVSTSATQYEFMDARNIPSRTGLYGNTPAPRGHYLLTAFKTERATLSGISGIQESSSDGLRPSNVSFYAGRVFYAGVGKSGFSSLIYFSQIIERDDQIGKCYQANDPTSREIFDLLDNDGGVIDIQDINTIHDMKVVGNALIIFASNGIWSVSGTDNTPFKATDYSVSKITSEAALSRLSVVDISGAPVWWNHEGIFTLKPTELGLTSDITSLTVASIQSFYDDIPQNCKEYAKGQFNSQTNITYWIYSSDANNPTRYDRILVLDAVSMAFYPMTIPVTPLIRIKGILSLKTSGPLFTNDPVVTNLQDPVMTSTSDTVYVKALQGIFTKETEFVFTTEVGPTVAESQFTFSHIVPDEYLDWGTTSYDAYFVSGYRIRGEVIKKSQTNYLTILMDTLPGSSCYMQGIWDYANTPNTGRYTNPQQAYKPKAGFDYQISRLKIRGTGTSLQFKFTGVSGAPMSIIGWAGYETANGAP